MNLIIITTVWGKIYQRFQRSSSITPSIPINNLTAYQSCLEISTSTPILLTHPPRYDNDITVFSPQGRIHQIEYAMEAVKQGSAAVGLRSNTHTVILALKRAQSELASYQNKIIKIDAHLGIAVAGLISDANLLSTFMRTEALKSKMLFDRPVPTLRIVTQISDSMDGVVNWW
jgi:hypothetical protein